MAVDFSKDKKENEIPAAFNAFSFCKTQPGRAEPSPPKEEDSALSIIATLGKMNKDPSRFFYA